jgi:ubiquitin C-terminal hydrolase
MRKYIHTYMHRYIHIIITYIHIIITYYTIVSSLKKLIKKYKLEAPVQVVEKRELVDVLDGFYEGKGKHKEVTKYDLIANLCHEGKPEKGAYKVHIHQRSCNTWYEMQDLHVWSTETMPQLVALSETYIQVYELHRK